ncbi:MAG TPA: rRNA adenine N-6-methyltransferase family protein, partial [Thermoanaerobaculaceae bacterium]|nr:rRNA adenine N-6-methyltransferase family protein [Thermoanaerobaculaceae bacterium]
VIHLRVRTAPPVPVADLERFSEVVRAAFSQRRKNLANALGSGLQLRVDRLRELLAGIGIDPARRAETLSLADFARLAEMLRSARAASTATPSGSPSGSGRWAIPGTGTSSPLLCTRISSRCRFAGGKHAASSSTA